MDAVPCIYTGLKHSGSGQDDGQPIVEEDGRKRGGCGRRRSSEETVDCPTCRGRGYIPRGQESRLVSVIPCSDWRLRPRHTKRYVMVSVAMCLLVSCLVLYFLFPRSVLLSSVSIQSSLIYFSDTSVQIDITHILNITNHNFVAVQVHSLSVQALKRDLVVGAVTIDSATSVSPLSDTMYSFMLPIRLTDTETSNYCKSSSLPVQILFLHLQMSMTVNYLGHNEQLSLETYEFINCGANSTVPRTVQPF